MVLLARIIACEWAVLNNRLPPAFPSELTSPRLICPFQAESACAPLPHGVFRRKCDRVRDVSTDTVLRRHTARRCSSSLRIPASHPPLSAQSFLRLHPQQVRQTPQSPVAMYCQRRNAQCRRCTRELAAHCSSLQSAAPRGPMVDSHSSQSSGCCRFLS